MNPYMIKAVADALAQERIAEAAAWRQAQLVSRQRNANLREAMQRQVVRIVCGLAKLGERSARRQTAEPPCGAPHACAELILPQP